jgi:hypothetical protein
MNKTSYKGYGFSPADIAYLRKPNNHTRVAFEDAKTAAAVALEILDTEVA